MAGRENLVITSDETPLPGTDPDTATLEAEVCFLLAVICVNNEIQIQIQEPFGGLLSVCP